MSASVPRWASRVLCAWVVAVLSCPLLVPASALEAMRLADLQTLRHAFGEGAPDRVRRFAALLRAHEPLRSLADRPSPSRLSMAGRPDFLPGRVAAEGAAALQDRWRLGLLRQAELGAIRLGVAGCWLVVLWPLLGASLLDGWMQRRVRQAASGAVRPTAFTLAGLAVAGLAPVPLMFVTLPLPWPQGWMPGWAIALGLALAIRIALGRPRVDR